MKKREITPVELKKIIDLRQLGSEWTQIAAETRVERRAAKRAYEEWKHDKEIREQQAVRFRVAAEAFHEHLDDLIKLAAGLVSNLSISPSLADLEKNSEQHFSSLWKQDFLRRYIPPESGGESYSGDRETYYREQELLFESLKAHTKEQVRWDVLDVNWRNARDECADIIPRLRKEISKVVGNSIIQQKMAGSMEKTKKRTVEGDPEKRIEGTMLKQIWQSVFWDKLDLENPRFETETNTENILVKSRDLHIQSRDETVFTFTNITDKGIAENLTLLCNLVVDTLIKGNAVLTLCREVGNIKKAHEELREMLNPVKLRPVILRSRCELCPV